MGDIHGPNAAAKDFFEKLYILFLEKKMAIHSSTLAWKIPWTEEPVDCRPWGCEESKTTEHMDGGMHTHTWEAH